MAPDKPFIPVVFFVAFGVFGLLSLSAWLQVQSVRLSYRSRAVQREIDHLSRQEQALQAELDAALSLSRLDECARRRGLTVPRPEQIRIQ